MFGIPGGRQDSGVSKVPVKEKPQTRVGLHVHDRASVVKCCCRMRVSASSKTRLGRVGVGVAGNAYVRSMF